MADARTTRLGAAGSIALFGGTFDPVHYAHLLLADAAVDDLGVDLLVFMPAFIPPHKQGGRLITDHRHRRAMLELAIADDERFAISSHELDQQKISYTYDTLAWLRSVNPGAVIHLLLGGDSALDFPKWHRPVDIAGIASVAVVARPGAALPDELLPGIGYHRIGAPLVDISSTDIRMRIAEGRSVRYRLPAAVIDYIQQHGLYR